MQDYQEQVSHANCRFSVLESSRIQPSMALHNTTVMLIIIHCCLRIKKEVSNFEAIDGCRIDSWQRLIV